MHADDPSNLGFGRVALEADGLVRKGYPPSPPSSRMILLCRSAGGRAWSGILNDLEITGLGQLILACLDLITNDPGDGHLLAIREGVTGAA